MFYVASHMSSDGFSDYPDITKDKNYFTIINLSNEVNTFADVNDKDSDENIHSLNPQLNELTAAYWGWKNDNKSKWKGLCHYHRYLSMDGKTLLTGKEIDDLFTKDKYDVICMGKYSYNNDEKCDVEHSMWEALSTHSSNDVMSKALGAILNGGAFINCKENVDVLFNHLLHRSDFMTNNVFACRSDLFDDYCNWIFSFAIPAAEICTDDRIIGFCCERLFSCWIDLKVKENPNIKVLKIRCIDTIHYDDHDNFDERHEEESVETNEEREARLERERLEEIERNKKLERERKLALVKEAKERANREEAERKRKAEEEEARRQKEIEDAKRLEYEREHTYIHIYNKELNDSRFTNN